jgi:hypothetical protein
VMMEAVNNSETPSNLYEAICCKVPEDSRVNICRSGNLKCNMLC